MISVIAKLRAKAGSEAEFEAVAREMVLACQAEPLSRGYTLWKTAEAGLYTIVEVYDDEAGLAAHVQTDHYRQIGRRMGALMDGRPEITRLHSV